MFTQSRGEERLYGVFQVYFRVFEKGKPVLNMDEMLFKWEKALKKVALGSVSQGFDVVEQKMPLLEQKCYL